MLIFGLWVCPQPSRGIPKFGVRVPPAHGQSYGQNHRPSGQEMLSVLFAFFSFLSLSPLTEHSPQRQQQVPPAAVCIAGPTPTHHHHPPLPLPKKVCAGPLQTHWQHSLTPQPFLHSNPPTFRYKDGWISSVLACYAENFFFLVMHVQLDVH